jgi:hypothetical protein
MHLDDPRSIYNESTIDALKQDGQEEEDGYLQGEGDKERKEEGSEEDSEEEAESLAQKRSEDERDSKTQAGRPAEGIGEFDHSHGQPGPAAQLPGGLTPSKSRQRREMADDSDNHGRGNPSGTSSGEDSALEDVRVPDRRRVSKHGSAQDAQQPVAAAATPKSTKKKEKKAPQVTTTFENSISGKRKEPSAAAGEKKKDRAKNEPIPRRSHSKKKNDEDSAAASKTSSSGKKRDLTTTTKRKGAPEAFEERSEEEEDDLFAGIDRRKRQRIQDKIRTAVENKLRHETLLRAIDQYYAKNLR